MSTLMNQLTAKRALVLAILTLSVVAPVKVFAQTPIYYYDDGYSVPPQNTAQDLEQIRRSIEAAANTPEPSVHEAIFVGLGIAMFMLAISGGILMVRDRIRRAR